MVGPVLDHKMEKAHEALRSIEVGECYSFNYKDETWHFTKLDMWEDEPVFSLDIEVRGEFHEL